MLLSSEDKNRREIQEQLIKLWCDVFGDSEEYVRLYLPYLSDFEIFCILEEGEIKSCFYLLPSEIRSKGKTYKGYYLYAAATDESSRGKGYMGSLINEAISTFRDKVDFISLVPANEGLYSYYSRFGFESVMYNYETLIDCISDDDKFTNGKVLIGREVNEIRRNHLDNGHFYTDKTMDYALRCYGFSNSEFLKNDKAAYLYLKEEKVLYELFSDAENMDEYLSLIRNNFEGKTKVVTSFELTEKSKKIKCGMVILFCKALENEKEIYMNHTLM